MEKQLYRACRGVWLAAALCVSRPALAQSTPQSMLDVRLAAQEYRAAEDKEAVEKAEESGTTTISAELLAAHSNASSASATAVSGYLVERAKFTDAISKRRTDILAAAHTAITPLQLQWLNEKISKLKCDETKVPLGSANSATIVSWYTTATGNLTAVTSGLTTAAPTAPPTTEAELKRELAVLAVDLEDCYSPTVALVRGLGEGLFTGSRLIPAVTVLADVTHFQPSGSAFIGGLELTGLNADALKQIDSSAVRRNLLYPELSTFGAGLTLGICKHSPDDKDYKRSFVGVLWRGSYLLKNLRDPAATSSDTRQVGTDHLLSTLTVEYVVPKISLAFFAAYNYQEVVGGREAFRRIVETNVTSFNYLSWGVRGRLNVGSSKGTKNLQNINVEIGFMQLTNRMQALLQTTDPLIPTIRVGFNHRILDNLKAE